MVMETPSPQIVGREFVRQYYTLLHEAPRHLHRFYSHNSCFVHGGVDKPGEQQTPVMGQAEIHEKIMSLNFLDCHAKIRQVDSQATVGNAVVVQVTGELSNSGQPMRRFMQTFVLVPQSPKKYYVHNDIFRYQDEVFHDNDTDTEIQEEVDSEQDINEIVSPDPPVAAPQPQVSAYYEPASVPPLSNGTVHQEEPMAVEPAPLVKPVAVPEETIKVEEPQPEPIKEEMIETKEVVEEEPLMTPQEEEPKSNAPVSWAAMLAGKSAGGPPPVVKQTPPPPQMSKPVDQKPLGMGGDSAPQPQRAPRGPRERGPPRDREGSSRSTTVEPEDTRRSRYPDSHQVFVGNLPHQMPESELKLFFEQYGKVMELRINKKGSNPNVPNYGFVVFDEEKTVEKVLSNKGPFMLQGHRLNVEEKKQRGSEGGRPGSGTRLGGRGGGMGRGGNSGPPRGRGGGMGSGFNRQDGPRGPSNTGANPGGNRGGFGVPRR
uniref:Ras-GTPase-activating protein-binding-like protein n=1 Tax=Platynereis dumerilii TaxID=6359 RepID=A0AAT9PXD0_PLADU